MGPIGVQYGIKPDWFLPGEGDQMWGIAPSEMLQWNVSKNWDATSTRPYI